MRYLIVIGLLFSVGTGGCAPIGEREPNDVMDDPTTDTVDVQPGTLSDFDALVWDYSINAFLFNHSDVKDSCLQAPTVTWVDEFEVCRDDVGGCAYHDDDGQPNVEMLNGAYFYQLSVDTCAGRVSGLLHEYMHHHMYCVEGHFGHPNEYFGKSLDNLRNQATDDICDE